MLGRLELEQRWSFVTMTSLTAFVQTRVNDGPDDWDLSSSGELLPVALASAPNVIRYQLANVYFSGFPLDDHEWSEELRLSGGYGKLQWLGGLYWADNHSLTHVGFAADGRDLAPGEFFVTDVATTNTPLTLVPYGRDAGTNRFGAVFGSLSYAVSASWMCGPSCVGARSESVLKLNRSPAVPRIRRGPAAGHLPRLVSPWSTHGRTSLRPIFQRPRARALGDSMIRPCHRKQSSGRRPIGPTKLG